MDDNYTNAHRAFLQACGRHSVLSLHQAKEILVSIQENHGYTDSDVNETTVRKIVDEINARLMEREIEQRLNFVHFEWDDIAAEFLVFCNTFASVGPSPVYNEAECMYMKNLLEKIIMSDTHSMSLMTAVHLCLSSAHPTQSQSQSTSKKVTKQRAEELLDDWSAAGYLMMIGDSITLGPRGIGEYRNTFQTKFSGYIPSCHLCNNITLQPNFCTNDGCDAALDKRCYQSYVLKTKKCPGCKSIWQTGETDAE